MEKVVKFITLGCKVNQYETNAMAQKFLEKGYTVIEENNESSDKIADICVINTCTVTNMSDRKSRQMLRRMKEKNEKSIIVACRMLCTSCKRRTFKNTRNRFSFRK